MTRGEREARAGRRKIAAAAMTDAPSGYETQRGTPRAASASRTEDTGRIVDSSNKAVLGTRTVPKRPLASSKASPTTTSTVTVVASRIGASSTWQPL